MPEQREKARECRLALNVFRSLVSRSDLTAVGRTYGARVLDGSSTPSKSMLHTARRFSCQPFPPPLPASLSSLPAPPTPAAAAAASIGDIARPSLDSFVRVRTPSALSLEVPPGPPADRASLSRTELPMILEVQRKRREQEAASSVPMLWFVGVVGLQPFFSPRPPGSLSLSLSCRSKCGQERERTRENCSLSAFGVGRGAL